MRQWLATTSTRLSIDALRQARSRGGALDTEPESRCEEGALDARERLAALRANVPPREMEAVLLCRVEGHAHPAAARMMGVSERTIRRLLDRFDRRPRLGSMVLGLVLALAAAFASRSCSASETIAPIELGAP
jgi:DNA-directed RNA polymerase specialized sigma24 family protein